MNKIKYIFLLLPFTFFLTGCRWAIINEQDNAYEITGKVASRILLGISTLGFYELGIMEVKNMDSFLGCTKEELLLSLGAPSTTYTAGNVTVWEYVDYVTYTTPGRMTAHTSYTSYSAYTNATYSPPTTNTLTVTKKFYIVDNTIIRWSLPLGYWTAGQEGDICYFPEKIR